MKEKRMKRILVLLMFILSVSLFSAYHEGDVVEDIGFKDLYWDQSGSMSTTSRSIHDLIDNGQAVVLYFFKITYS